MERDVATGEGLAKAFAKKSFKRNSINGVTISPRIYYPNYSPFDSLSSGEKRKRKNMRKKRNKTAKMSRRKNRR